MYASRYIALGVCLILLAGSALAVPAFPGAEGYGAITPGGRGGAVYHVTTLADSGPGSFRAACSASGARTVVFDVSGTIQLTSELSITNPYITIAGQTAPGDGICVAGETLSLDTHDIIVRYLRVRRGNTSREDDALGSDRTTGNIVVDHCSVSWGLDENLSIYRYKDALGHVSPTENVTIQWCISSEALDPCNHAFGATWGGDHCNYHHNLFACNTGRNPSISFSNWLDLRNNVLFNWRHRSVDGAGPEAHVNMINNYYKSGPVTYSGELKYRIVKPEIRDPNWIGPGCAGWWYVEGNYVNGYPGITAENWSGGVQFEEPGMDPNDARVTTPWATPDIVTQSAEDAYELVLAGVGAVMPARDAVDQRIVSMVEQGTVTFGNGIINHPSDVGGYPTLNSLPAPTDSDQDGMSNTWETAHGLNPYSASDRNGDYDADGYTNLEEYINDLAAFKATQPIVWDGGTGRYELIDNWDIAWQPSSLDVVQISSGKATVGYLGQQAGTIYVGNSSGELAVTAGSLGVTDGIYLGNASGSQGTLTCTGGTLLAGGQIVVASAAGSTGELTVTKDALVQVAGLNASSASGRVAKINLEVGASDGSMIHTSGSSALGGTVNVDWLDSTRPKEGDTFQIIDSSDPNATYTGSFDAMLCGDITMGIPSGLDPFGGQANGEDYELVFQGLTEGDANGDHAVNGGDLALMGGNWMVTSGRVWLDGDFNGDGAVDGGDLALIGGNWMWTLPAPPPGKAVPEPATLALLAMASAALLRRGR